jgi:hypothetical protein
VKTGRGRLTDYLVKVFNSGQVFTSDGKHATYNADFTRVKNRIKRFESDMAADAAVRNAKAVEVGKGKQPATSKAKTKDVAEKPQVAKEVPKPKEKEVAKKTRERKQVDKAADPALSASDGEDGKTRKDKAPKALVHRDNGRMTTERRKSAVVQPKERGKKIKSASVVGTTDDEVEVERKGNADAEESGKKKAQRKPRADESDAEEQEDKAKGRRRGNALPKVVREDSESEGEENTKGKRKVVAEDTRQRKRKEDSEEDEEDVTPLERARQRAESKAPAPPPEDCIEVEDKCARCVKMKVTCLWTPEAIKKSGPKACWRCKTKKIGCINSYRGSGPVMVDLATPLEDLIEHLTPPTSDAAGVPRSGIAGEAENPTTLGELLVEVLANIRAVKEENMELKAQMKSIQGTLDSMMAHDSKSHLQVMEAVNKLPTIPRREFSIPVALSPPISSSHRPPTPAAARPPSTSPPPTSPPGLMHARVQLDLTDSEEESTPRRPALKGVSSASRANEEGEEQGDEESTIPSMVANHTRQKTQKTRAAASPEEASEVGSGSEEEDVPSPKTTKPKKRKVTAVDNDEDPAVPAKKTKVAAAGKAKEAKVAPIRKPPVKKGKNAAS